MPGVATRQPGVEYSRTSLILLPPESAMSRLQAELSRLYLPHPSAGQGVDAAEPGLIGADGRVRAMVLEVARPADWDAVARVWKGVQADLGLPAPAIAVSGIDSYQLWFSLLEPLPVARAHEFLEALRVRHLRDIAPERVRLLPTADTSTPLHAAPVPALQAQTGCWSAFVAPDLAAMFGDTPWLDIPPGHDGQSDLLSRLESITAADFRMALERLVAAAAQASAPDDATAAGTGQDAAGTRPSCGGADPKRFLLDVMNNESVALGLRIEAARALLPYFDNPRCP
jgi:hypothetical protein